MDKNIVISLLIFGLITVVQLISAASRHRKEQLDETEDTSIPPQQPTMRELLDSLYGDDPEDHSSQNKDIIEDYAANLNDQETPNEVISEPSSLAAEFELSREFRFSTPSIEGSDDKSDLIAVENTSEDVDNQDSEPVIKDFNLRDAVLYSEIINRRRF